MHCSGFGSLEIWKDIQTIVPESKINGMTMTDKEESKEESKSTDKEEEEEEKVDSDEEEDADDEAEEERGTTNSTYHILSCFWTQQLSYEYYVA